MSSTMKHPREDDVEDQTEKKKRRVVVPSTKSSEKLHSAADKIDSKHSAKSLFNAEENEVLQREAGEDVDAHKEVVSEMQSIMTRVSNLKKSNLSDDKKKEAIEKLKSECVLHFLSLKKLNRVGHFRCKKIRELTHEAKQKVDRKHLGLQNLLYELMHLQKEISKCIQFKSTDEEINLISEEEFLQAAPKEITGQLLKEGNPHKMMLARLDWELRERKDLSAKFSESLKSKEAIQKEIERLKTNLKSLSPILCSVLESTKPVQEHLNMPFDENLKKQKIANHLPPPLYFLFLQASSYGEACDKELSVEIIGDVELALSVEKLDSPMDEESESEEEGEQTNKVHRRSTTDSRLMKKQEQLLKRHPLAVSLKVTPAGKGSVTLLFQYLVNLEFVVVSADIQVDAKTSDGKELSAPSNQMAMLFEPLCFLDRLYEDDDDGEETPNPVNVFKLAKFGITDLASHLEEVGRPYRWVQRLCGVQNMAPTNCSLNGDSNLAQRRMSYIEELAKLLKKRMISRLDLFKQLTLLDAISDRPNANWISAHNFSNVPKKVSSRLILWRNSSCDEFMNSSVTKNVVESELACSKDFFYFGSLERSASINGSQSDGGNEVATSDEDKAVLTFFVVVTPDYPQSLPLFCVKVSWRGTERSALNDEALRELEGSVNLRSFGDLDHKNALLNQVAMLSTCFDVYLETGGLGKSVDDLQQQATFEGDKSYLRLARGPTRSKPYRFMSKLGFFSHF